MKMSVFLERLQDDMAPKLNELPEICALCDRENFIAMLYAFAALRELYTVQSMVQKLPSAFAEIPYELFDPSLIVRLGSDVSTIVGDDYLEFLCRASIMMRTMADTITGLGDEEILINAEIPPLQVMTIEVRYSLADQSCQDEVYRFLRRC